MNKHQHDGYDTLMDILYAGWMWQHHVACALHNRGSRFEAPIGNVAEMPLSLRTNLANSQAMFEHVFRLTAEAETMRAALEDHGIFPCSSCGAYVSYIRQDEHERCPACSWAATAEDIGNAQRDEDERNYNQIVSEGLRWAR